MEHQVMVKLDFGNVSSEPIPEGMYSFQIADVGESTTSKGNAQMDVKLSVIQPDEHIGRVVWDNFVLVPQSLWVLQKFLEAATGKEWKDSDMDLEPKELVGLFVRGTVMHKENPNQPGVVRARIREYFPDL